MLTRELQLEGLFRHGGGVKQRGFLIVLSGPSGAGKNSLLSKVLPRVPGLIYSVSATTRPPRVGEKDGVNYFFLSDEEFQQWIDQGEFLEWAEFAGYKYGTPRRFVMECIEQGRTVITDIDIQGARQIKSNLTDAVFVFLMPPSAEELYNRLQARGTDTGEAIKRRLEIGRSEIEAVFDYHYWVLNDDLDEACDTLIAIIKAEQSRVDRTFVAGDSE